MMRRTRVIAHALTQVRGEDVVTFGGAASLTAGLWQFDSRVALVVIARGRMAEVVRANHHAQVSALLSTQEMMTLFGWTDEKMPRHYTQQVQAANAIAAHRRASPLDRLPK